MSQETETQEVVTAAQAVTQAVNLVSFPSGDRDFGKKGQIQKEVTINDEGIIVKFFLVTGLEKELAFSKSNPLYDIMASRGIIEFVGNAVAGVYQDKEGLHPEDFNLGIEKAITSLEAGVISTRESSDKSTKGLGDLIRAYVELRSKAGDRFSEEEKTYEFVKTLILGSDEVTNKQRLAQAPVKAKIEQYKLERQQAKTNAAQAKVDDMADLI